MTRSVPRFGRIAIPALFCCLPLIPLTGMASGIVHPHTTVADLAQAADNTVTGRVVDDKGEPIPGVNVVIKGTTTGTQTNIDGRYTLSAPSGATLVFSSIGFKSKEVVVGSESTVDVALETSVSNLDEVVVVGYLQQDRQNVTSAVASLDVKEASKQAGSNVVQQMQGRIAGVQIDGGGGPGGVPNIVIRGVGSIALNSNPLYIVDGLWVEDIRPLNPSDIETLTVLKDASSTSVYGSRGANGVVLITTKRGKSGAPDISFSGYEGIESVSKKYDMMDGPTWQRSVRTAYANAGRDLSYLTLTNTGLSGVVLPSESPNGKYNPATAANTNWQKEFFQNGRMRDYNITLSGGTTNGKTASNYLISGGYFNQEGVVKGPTFERYSLRLNSGITRGRFKFQQSTGLTHINTRLLNGAPFIDVLSMVPMIPVRDPNEASGSGFGYGSDSLKTFATNPIGAQEQLRRTQRNERIQTSLIAEFRIADWLTYKLNYSIDGHLYTDRNTEKKGNLRFNDGARNGTVSEGRGYQVFTMIENTLNFQKSINEAHNISAVVGYSEQKNKTDYAVATNNGYSAPYYFTLSSGAGIGTSVQGRFDTWARRSYFGQATYDYRNRYLVTFAARRDGSSKFWDGTDPNKLYGNFYAASLGWRMSEEKFWKENLAVISNAKLRASYGVNGNDQVNNYFNQSAISPVIGYPLGTSQNVVFGSIQTRLTSFTQWEQRYTQNVGLDLGFFGNRLTATMDYFINETRRAIVQPAVPLYLGNYDGPVFKNGGTIQNRGLELALGYHDRKGDFTYGIDAAITSQRNKATILPDSIIYLPNADQPQVTRTSQGTEISTFYLIPMEGIFQSADEVANYKNAAGTVIQPYASPGDVKYKDVNGDGKIDNSDRVNVGSYFPKLVYSLNLSAAYKGFDISIYFQGTRGSKIFNTARANIEANGINNYRNDISYWTAENPSSVTPRLLALDGATADLAKAASMNSYFQSTRWLESGDYFRVKNVQIGYTFPASATKKAGIERLRIYVSARNLLTVTPYSGYDPEIQNSQFQQGVDNSTYPNVRTILGGFQFNF